MTSAAPSYDLAKWAALAQYDEDIKRIVDALAPFGQKYVDEFAEAFMALNDKNYLPQIIEKILATAKANAERTIGGRTPLRKGGDSGLVGGDAVEVAHR